MPSFESRLLYLQVMDLADGHLDTLNCLKSPSVHIFNLGIGKGLSVLDMVNSFLNVTGVKIPHAFTHRREGDLPVFWADASKAERKLAWKASRTLDQMMEDPWGW